MGLEGPCGPCTEIHYSHIEGTHGRQLVNAPHQDDVVELWNLVFIEHYLRLSGNLDQLENQHVDTGMGLERLTALLNGSRSNYDTDLFLPHFTLIKEFTRKEPYQGTYTL